MPRSDIAAPRLAGLVLAAGASRRFGAVKQLARLEDRPLLEHALAAMAGARLPRVVVTLGARADEILAAVDLHGAEPLVVEDWEEGQAASLRAGVAALAPHADAIVVTLGDQPRVGAEAIARLAALAGEIVPAHAAGAGDVARARAARATWEGVPGHPVLLGRSLFGAVASLRGDVGARALLDGAVEVECGRGSVLDVDTPADLRALDGG